MGCTWSRPQIPAMEESARVVVMDETTYDLKTIKSPTLRGWKLALFTRFVVDSFLWKIVAPKLFRRSGITAALRERRIPEPPCYEPVLSTQGDLGAVSVTHVTCTSENSSERANRASEICRSWAGDTRQSSPERLSFRPRIRDFCEAYSSGLQTPTEVIEETLQRMREMQASATPMNFFISLDEEDARRQAAESTERWKEGRPRSVLEGVPVAVKDDMDQLPYKTTFGTRFMGAALRRAGAVLLGKANMHEIGQGVTGWNSHHGAARNPYDPARLAGGSSSGSAALVAAGVCPVTIGADGGGSIRVPSAFCGVFGLIPTHGRTGQTHKSLPMVNTVGRSGPIAGGRPLAPRTSRRAPACPAPAARPSGDRRLTNSPSPSALALPPRLPAPRPRKAASRTSPSSTRSSPTCSTACGSPRRCAARAAACPRPSPCRTGPACPPAGMPARLTASSSGCTASGLKTLTATS
uniref:Fatty acid amide hydrolase-like n=1 Tax=Tetraselmis sp. GSL018 TaxID=582737 RepID=A0A061R1V2_9CHLO